MMNKFPSKKQREIKNGIIVTNLNLTSRLSYPKTAIYMLTGPEAKLNEQQKRKNKKDAIYGKSIKLG